MGNTEFGYIGKLPSQSASGVSGVFSTTESKYSLDRGEYPLHFISEDLITHIDATDSTQFNESSSGTLYDFSTNSNNGGLNGINVSNYSPSSGGNTAKALIYPSGNTTTYATLPDSTIYDTRGAWSWDFVAAKITNTGRATVFSQINNSSPWNGLGVISISHDSNGQLAWWLANSNSTWWDTGISVALNKWVYCAGTWSGNSLKVYYRTVGSSSFSTATYTSAATHNGGASNQTFKVGSEASVDPIDGAVSMIRVWGQALTDDEVTTNFNSIKNVYGL